MQPTITTIIPTYRRPQLLRRAITSVLEQDYESIKICIYDNDSQDNTKEIVSEFSNKDKRVSYFSHTKNIGSLENFLHGMSNVQTELFSFLSDDDYLLPGFYKRAVNALSKNSKAMFWAGMSLRVDEKGVIWDARASNWSREGVFEPPESFIAMTGGMAPPWTSILFRREAIESVGLIDSSLQGPSDLEYCLRLAAHHPFIFEKYPAAVYFLNSQSFSATQPMSAFWPGWKEMLKKFQSDPALSLEMRQMALNLIQQDAKKMLFRRGANALAAGRLDFAQDAAEALAIDCRQKLKSSILRTIAGCCARSNLFQRFYTTTYRKAEQRIVKSNSHLQAQYGHLLRSS
ncbi:MAG: glycosyltransferase family 2 protein [Pseudomonadaceae bacterium]